MRDLIWKSLSGLIPGSDSRRSRKVPAAFLAILAFLIPAAVRAQTYYYTGNLPMVPGVNDAASAIPCDASAIGAIRYNTGTAIFEGCNGTAWADIRNGAIAGPAGSDGQVQFNNAGALGASASFTWNNATGALTAGSFNSTTGGQVAGFISPNSVTSYMLFQMAGPSRQPAHLWRVGTTGANSDFNIYNQNSGNTAFYANWSTGNVGIGTTTPGTSVDVNGGVTMEPSTVTLTANNTVLDTANRSYFRVTSDNTTPANRIFCFGAGTIGQVLIIEWASSTNKGEIVKGGNCSAATGAVPASLSSTIWAPFGAETILQLMYNGTHWIQIAGSANF